MKVSAALIVKNEERTLPRCLSSIREHVDEIVVMDTGSTDRTPEIARQFSAKVFHTTWRRDFSLARQQAFDRATGDWVFWLDADDVVANADRIRAAVESAPPQVKGIYWKYVVGRDEYGNSTCEFWRERCVRNDGSFRWLGRVHEVLYPRAPVETTRAEDVVVYHMREEKPGRSPSRNLEILREEYRRCRYRPPARLLLMLANEHADLNENAAAIDYFRQYTRISTWNDERYFALLRMARLLRQQQSLDEAADAALLAVRINPFWPNAYFSLAETYYQQKDWARVAHWADIGRRQKPPDTICITNPREHRFDWIIYYTNALFYLGRTHEAFEWTEHALEICPADTWHMVNWHFFAEAIRRSAPPLPIQAKDRPPAIFWHAPLLDCSGYADEARQFVLGLHAIGERVRAIPVFWDHRRVPLPSRDLATLCAAARTPTAVPGEQVISVFHLTGQHFERIPGAVLHIGRTMCETDRIPPDWVATCNRMDEVWVPCKFNIETFASSGVSREKLVMIPESVDADLFLRPVPPLPIEGGEGFTFLSVFEWTRRKGWDALLRAFVEEFGRSSKARLVFKVGVGRPLAQYREEASGALRSFGLSGSLPANVIFYQATLPAEDLPRLYRAADAFALPSRGEGWGRPLMEAMAVGVPAIATRWSGQLEFMNDANSWLVGTSLVDVPESGWREAVIFRGHRWAEPDIPQLRAALRQVFEDRDTARQKAEAGREHIVQNFNRIRVAEIIRDRLRLALAKL